MAAITEIITKFTVAGDGSIHVFFGKIERVYNSLSHMKSCVRASLTRDDLRDLALALVLTRQPNLTNPSVFEGHSITVDFTLANWGSLT